MNKLTVEKNIRNPAVYCRNLTYLAFGVPYNYRQTTFNLD